MGLNLKAPPKIYLDTNIFVYAFERPDSIEREVSNKIIELIAYNDGKRPPFLFTSTLSFAELWVGAYKSNDNELITQYENLAHSSMFLEVGEIDLGVLRYAAVTRAQNSSIKLPDAIHLSTAVGFECTHFLTADLRIKDGFQLTHTRYGITKSAPSLTVIRPDLNTLSSLMELVESHA